VPKLWKHISIHIDINRYLEIEEINTINQQGNTFQDFAKGQENHVYQIV